MTKNFSKGFDSLLGGSAEPKTATPKPEQQTETRATFIIKEDSLDKLKAIAYWERLKIKDVLNDFLEQGIAKYEKKNGEIKDLPSK
jgi:hypothetical protein